MKFRGINHAGKVAAVMALGLGVAAPMALADSPEHARQGSRHLAQMQDPFMSAVRGLRLTDDQRSKLRALLSAQRQARLAGQRDFRAEMRALVDPGNPGHAAAVQAAQRNAAERIQRRNDLDEKIYALLTPDQRQRFSMLLDRRESRGRGWGGGRRGWRRDSRTG